MSAVVTAIPREVTTRSTVDEWAKVIRADFRQSVEGIVAAGQHLAEAKEQVDHGEFGPLLERIGISGSTARKLMAIAEHPVISDRSHWNVLPPSWTTLYTLTGVPPDLLKKRIAEGRVTPDMEREDVGKLYSNRDETPPPARRKRLKRIPNRLITSWEFMEKFCEIVRHNAQVLARRYERSPHPEDIDHKPTVGVAIMVSRASIEELDRYVARNPGGMNRREVMQHAIEVLCQGLREFRLKDEERIACEQRQKYDEAMAEKRAREAEAAA
jgi:hypothetical protein